MKDTIESKKIEPMKKTMFPGVNLLKIGAEAFTMSQEKPHIASASWISLVGGFFGQYAESWIDFHFIGAKIMKQSGIPYPKPWKSPFQYYTTCTRGISSFQASVLLTATMEEVGKDAYTKFKKTHGLGNQWDFAVPVAIGVLGSFFAVPVEHTVLTLQKNKSTPREAFSFLIKNHGWRRPWTGLYPTMIREGIYWGGLGYADKSIAQWLEENYGSRAKLLSPFITGCVASAFSEPFDITAREMQNSIKPDTLVSTMKKIYQQKGFSFFYQGYLYRTASIVGSYIWIPLITNETKKWLDGESSEFATAIHVPGVSQAFAVGGLAGIAHLVSSCSSRILQYYRQHTALAHKEILQRTKKVAVRSMFRVLWSNYILQNLGQEPKKNADYAFSGFLGGVAAAFTSKSFQLPISSQGSESFLDLAKNNIKKMSISDLYFLASCRAMTSGIKTFSFFSVMPALRKNAEAYSSSDTVNTAVAGIGAGAFAGLFSYPFHPSLKENFSSGLKGIVSPQLFKSVLSHVARVTPGVALLGYMNEELEKRNGYRR